MDEVWSGGDQGPGKVEDSKLVLKEYRVSVQDGPRLLEEVNGG